MAFNPRDHLLDLKGKDYLQVPWRLAWLNDDYANGDVAGFLIETTEVYDRECGPHPRDKTKQDRETKYRVVVEILNGAGNVVKRGVGTGTGKQSEFALYIEKAETKAMGRALAMVGYGTQHTGDEFDMGDEISPVDGKLGVAIADAPVVVTKKPSKSVGAPTRAIMAPPVAQTSQPAPQPAQALYTPPASQQAPVPAANPGGPVVSGIPPREEILEWLRSQMSNPAVNTLMSETSAAYKASSGLAQAKISELPLELLEQLYLSAKLVAGH